MHITSRKIKRALGAALAGLCLGFSQAGAEEAKPAWFESLQVSGYVDAYYQMNFNGLSGDINNPASTVQRAFDTRQNEFTFSAAKLTIAGQDSASGVGGQLDLLFGPTGQIVTPGGYPIEQAFATFGLGPVAFKVGKMVTHVGYEVIETPLNLNYSRSILFTQIPFYHVGAMANYSPVEGLGIMLGVANSNSNETANDEAKDLMAQVSYSQVPGLGLIANYYLESNRSAAGQNPFENTHYAELIANYQVLENLGLGLDYLYKTTIASSQKDEAGNAIGTSIPDPETGLLKPFSPKSQGYALYVNYVTPVAGLSVIPRFEQYAMPDAPAFATEYTLTVKYAAGPLTHFLELRSDVEGPAGFYPSGQASADPADWKSNQLTLTYGAAYTF